MKRRYSGVAAVTCAISAPGVRKRCTALDRISTVTDRAMPVNLISREMPHIRKGGDDPAICTMSDAVALMTGAMQPDEVDQIA